MKQNFWAVGCMGLGLCCSQPLLANASPEMANTAPVMANATEKSAEHTFEVGDKTFLLDKQPFIVKAAEVHYPRIPREYWEHRIEMCKALGMNTLCLYVFWNIHEQEEGVYDFSGNNDVAAFCKLAQKHGMYVIVRPGPYVCAEWEMGGLPWWLLKKHDIKLRDSDPFFLSSVERFEKQVAKQLAPLTIENGGPIIMVQVENEYGSYGENKTYIGQIRDVLRESGFDKVTLFQCDWSSNFTKNGLEGLLWTMNFGTGANISAQFEKLQGLRPTSPLMCSEFWSGWFDGWGRNHETRDAKAMVAGLKEMLENHISFSLYMTHGGTSFAQWAGANSPGYKPDCTSYDYDAPINEAGQATPKFYELRQLLASYNNGQPLPDVPSAKPVITIPTITLNEQSLLFDKLPKPQKSENIRPMEDFNQGYGSILYRTTLPAINEPSLLKITEVHDFAMVYIDGTFIGSLSRMDGQHALPIPAIAAGARLDIFVDAMGRINFGQAIKDYKGITERVEIVSHDINGSTAQDLKNWQVHLFPFDYKYAAKRKFKTVDASTVSQASLKEKSEIEKTGYYRGSFKLDSIGDTFLDVSTWGKGIVWINGHSLGRFWEIGPQQTLYVPGCWLRRGKNEILVMDVLGPRQTTVRGLAEPVVDQLNLSQPVTHRKEGENLQLDSQSCIVEGSFAPGNGWQQVNFGKNVKARYLCIEALNNHKNDDYACIAELYVLDENGKRLSREPWKIDYADSEEIRSANCLADRVYDLQESTYWSSARKTPFPHTIVVDLGAVHSISALQYLPRMEKDVPGAIKDYRIYVQETPFKK